MAAAIDDKLVNFFDHRLTLIESACDYYVTQNLTGRPAVQSQQGNSKDDKRLVIGSIIILPTCLII
jgi:hypothetical protein